MLFRSGVTCGVVAIDTDEVYLLESHACSELYHGVCYCLSAVDYVGNVAGEAYGVLWEEHLVVCYTGDVVTACVVRFYEPRGCELFYVLLVLAGRYTTPPPCA